MDIDTGDVLFTRGKSLLNNVTCRLTGPAAHQATVYDSCSLVEASAQSGRIEKVDAGQAFRDLNSKGSDWVIFRRYGLSMMPMLRAQIQLDLLEATEFERYSYIELPLQALDVVLNHYILRRPLKGLDACVFRKLGNIWGDGVICSKTSNRALIKNGLIPVSSGLEYGSPSDTYNWMMLHKSPWSVQEYSQNWFSWSQS